MSPVNRGLYEEALREPVLNFRFIVVFLVAVDITGAGHQVDVLFLQNLALCTWSLFTSQKSQGTQSMLKR